MNITARIEAPTRDSITTYHANAGLLAMQYSYNLPADYNMSIIRERISSKGHLLNGFPKLITKAFAYAARDYNLDYTQANLYAPFYLWKDYDGMHRLFESEGFASLVETFGWPRVTTWSVLMAQFRDNYHIASWASRELIDILPYSELSQLQRSEADRISEEMKSKRILAGISAFEPAGWTLVRYRLWTTCPYHLIGTTTQIYQVGRLATEAA